MLPPYQQYYQQILSDPSVPSLLQPPFQDYNQPPYPSSKQIFPLCTQLNTPDFFKTNLLSPNRIIKYLNGQYCVYRAFYFQLFKLMFEIENEEKDYLEMFKEIVFDPDIIQRNGENSRAKRENSMLKANNGGGSQQQSQSESSRLSQLTQQQAFKRQFQTHQKCIAHFTQKVLQNKLSFSSFQHYLPYYPKIDQSMVLILQTFIQNANQSQQQQMDSIQSILQYLCEIFQIQLVVIDNCFKFQESDVFLFIEQKDDDEVWVYIAFNQIQEEEGDQGDQIQGNQIQREEDQRLDNHPYFNNNQPSNISQNHLSHNGPYKINQTSPHQHQAHSPPHASYPQQSHNNYTFSSNQNPSFKDNQSLTHKDNPSQSHQKSSSYRDNVITSQMKAQQSHHNYFSHFSPNNNFIQKSPHQFNAHQYDNTQNRPNRISSDKGSSHNDIRQQNQNPLTKSNHLPSNHQNPHNNYNVAENLPYKNNVTSYLGNQNQQQQRSINQLTPALSQSNGFIDNSKKQGRNFQKKIRYFDEDSIIEESAPSNKQLTKMQSITQSYLEEAFHKHPQKDQGFCVKKNQSQSSFQVVQSSSMRNITDRKVTDSKAQTIINMFGDMLGSLANINTFDFVHGSSSSTANGFNSSSHHKMQPQQDHGNNLYKDSYSKKYAYTYETSNNILVNEPVERNNVNMKKTKPEQVKFEAMPKESGDVFGKVEIREITVTRNQYVPNNSTLFEQASRKYNNNDLGQNSKLLMDSQELRMNNNGSAQFVNNNNEYYPFKNIGLDKSSNNQHKSSQQRQFQKYSPKNSDKQYLDNIQAKSYWGQQQKSNRNKSNPGSFHNSSRGSTKSHHLQHPVQPPHIKVNSIKSQSQTSSKELNHRNNYYREEDFTQLDGHIRQRGGMNDKDTLIKSQDNFNNNNNNENYRQTVRQEAAEKPNKAISLAHQSTRQQYVRVAPIQQTYNYKQKTQISHAYTSHNQHIPPNKTIQTQNTQQQDDFFFRPSNKSSLRYGLKTIQQVRASKQTNKDSYKIVNASKLSQNDKAVQLVQDKLHNKYELVNSITGLSQSIVGNRQYAAHNKGTYAVNKLMDTNAYNFKETSKQSKELNDESVNNGTFYKQFTNSKVLKLLKQPYKTKVQILKNRFKGQHRISINKVIT